ncbi:MAG TPA: hypothetical protein VJR89_28520, partial [Polyangiales bacterium]|nr:hypothetical protein [Polyangiales bacterium]
IPGRPQRPAQRRSHWLRSWLAFDERPQLIELAMTPAGRIALFACFGALLCFALPVRFALPVHWAILVLAGCAAAAFLREHRDRAVLLATLGTLLFDPTWYGDPSFDAYLEQLHPGGWLSLRNWQRLATAGLFVCAALGLRHVARHPKTWFARHPVLCLLGGLCAATLLASSLSTPPLWLVLAIKLTGVYLWFMCYAVADQRSAQRSSLAFSLGLFRPFWGSSSTPLGKGAGYLAKLRCDEPYELASLQLKALKLLAWSVVLSLLSWSVSAGSARLGIPELAVALRAFAEGHPVHAGIGWCAIVTSVAVAALELAVWGHRVVACARLAGWKLRRNTWRPLASRSLADFWNRYYFYFKELLLDFFFYPTFFRLFKKHARLRTFCATFMAAGVGNALYHFVRDSDRVLSLGPAQALQGFGSYAFYCFALASGIALSQLRTDARSARRQEQSGFFAAISFAWSFACVWGTVCCLHVFGGVEDRTIPFGARFAFLLHQLGVNP